MFMKLGIKDNKIHLDREKTALDHFVIKFIKTLNVRYVIVSGYVSILFGRSRTTEDVDILIEKISLEKFREAYSALKKAGFESVTTENEKELFDELDKEKSSIRFCEAGKYVPNMEIKFAKDMEDIAALTNAVDVMFKGDTIKISPLEMQIAYKLFLGKEGNEKDIEDARHLYGLFKDSLNKQKLNEWMKHLNVTKMVKYLG